MPEDLSDRKTRELEATGIDALAETLDGGGRARSVWELLRSGEDPLTAGQLSRRVIETIQAAFHRTHLRLEDSKVADCGTTKLVLALADGNRIETVLIPSERRTTACVSTQVGCGRGCVFCVTATMGLARGLTTGEIVGQVLTVQSQATRRELPPVRNVVFMGMGEPLDNLGPVRESIDILCDDHAVGLGPSHITISTVGPSPDAIRSTRDIPVRFAWSLHAVDDGLRRELIPTAKFRTHELRDAFIDRAATTTASSASLFVEVTLIDKVNDSLTHAEEMAVFLEPFKPGVRVNLLRMNPGRDSLNPSTESRAQTFRQRLRDHGYFCDMRLPRGTSANAACGQLVTSKTISGTDP